MRRASSNQPLLPFPGDSPAERQAANYAASEESIRRQYPMTDEERSWLPEGVRLARFVPFAECDGCKLGYCDHTINWRFPSKVCLKDLLAQGFDRSLLDYKFDEGENHEPDNYRVGP